MYRSLTTGVRKVTNALFVHAHTSFSPSSTTTPLSSFSLHLLCLPFAISDYQAPHSMGQPLDEARPYRFFLTISGTINPLFKGLLIFPSWYLFAIGIPLVFSFGRSLPPN